VRVAEQVILRKEWTSPTVGHWHGQHMSCRRATGRLSRSGVEISGSIPVSSTTCTTARSRWRYAPASNGAFANLRSCSRGGRPPGLVLATLEERPVACDGRRRDRHRTGRIARYPQVTFASWHGRGLLHRSPSAERLRNRSQKSDITNCAWIVDSLRWTGNKWVAIGYACSS
jgi:hypothetical protein